MLMRMNTIITKLGGVQAWNKTNSLVWIQHRMYTRQLTETSGVPPSTDPFSCKGAEYGKNKNLDFMRECSEGFPGSLVPEQIADGQMNYVAISESGMLLLHVFHGVQICAKDKKNSCPGNPMLRWALNQIEKLKENLEPRVSTFIYIKHMVKMLQHVMLGVIDLAENIRPHGLSCYAKKKCKAHLPNCPKIVKKVMNGPLKKATEIQKELMIQSSATPTLLLMPSFEIYGHVLLCLGKYAKAKTMFEASLQERMGRSLSVLGLARANTLLGNVQQADYFYKYLRKQLRNADNDNPMVKESEQWSMSHGLAETLRDQLFLPYFLKDDEETPVHHGEPNPANLASYSCCYYSRCYPRPRVSPEAEPAANSAALHWERVHCDL